MICDRNINNYFKKNYHIQGILFLITVSEHLHTGQYMHIWNDKEANKSEM